MQLLCNTPGVVQLQLAVQVLQLPNTSQEKVLHGRGGVWPILNNSQVMPCQAAPDADLHKLIHTAFSLRLQSQVTEQSSTLASDVGDTSTRIV